MDEREREWHERRNRWISELKGLLIVVTVLGLGLLVLLAWATNRSGSAPVLF